MSTPIPEWAEKAAMEAATAYLKADRSLANLVGPIARALMAEREACQTLCYERSKDAHRQAKRYELGDDETSQVQCLIAAVEAMDCASAIRDRSKT